jgi:diguanylate cyclase (GGDEF)-like protein
LNKRAHPRHSIHLNALVRVAGYPPCPATVRDFCLGGMFLALAPEEVALLSPPGRPLPRDSRIAIDFSLIEDGAPRAYQLSAKVARVIEQGLGVAFVDPDPRALDALERRARSSRDARAGAAARPPVTGLAADLRQRALRDLRGAVTERLAGLLVPFFRDIDQDLVMAANTSPSYISQGRYFDARALLKKSEDLVEAAFARGVLSELDALVEAAGPGGGQGSALGAGELSLIDQTDFEDMLATSEIATRAEERLAAPLEELQRRIAALTALSTDVSACPIGPAVFAEAFRSGVAGLGIDRQALHVVYRVFERGVVPGLTDLYRRANALLAGHGVEPVAPPSRTIVHHPAGETRRFREPEARPSAARRTEPEPEPAVPWSSAHQDRATRLPEPLPGPGTDRVPPDPPASAGAVGAVAKEPNPVRAAEPAGARTLRGAQTLLGLARWSQALGPRAAATPLPTGAAAEVPAGTLAPAAPALPPDPEAVLDVLTDLQRAPLDLEEAAGAGVRGRVLEGLARAQPDGRAPRLAPGQESAFELVEGLLRSVLEDMLLYGASKRRVGRLAAPLHKVALLDDGFLQDPAHPARRLVDRIGQIDPEGDAPDGEGPVWTRVDPVLDRISRSFDRDVGVFEDAARELDGIVEEQRARYRERVEQVVRASAAQQVVLRARRGTSEAARPPPPELAEWVSQARRLQVGDALELGAGTPRAERVELAWVAEDQGAFAFVNRRGEKVATLSLQEVAMQLRRGSARPLLVPAEPLVERALDGVMERVHRRLEDQARRDPSTGVLTPLAFEQALETASRDAALRKATYSLCYLDLDRFRVLLDVQGPAAGAAYMAALGPALVAAAPTSATWGRLAGDTFGILLPETGLEGARGVAEACRKAVLALRVDWEGAKLALTASVGVVALGPEGLHARDLLQAAQAACRAAKDAGHDRVRVFEAGDEAVRRRQEQRGALAHLSRALEEGRVSLRCQPIVPLTAEAGRLPHLEILLGVKDAEGRLVPPAELVAAAEQYEQAAELDRLVIRETLRWMSERAADLGRLGGCAVNLSPRSLTDESLAGFVIDQLMQSRVPPGKLVFEVTEAAATAGLSLARQFMRTLGDLGCRFSLDDFGSGHTSFAYLKGLPVDFVKIDGLFVQGLGDNPQDFAVVKSINEIAHVMGKQTIAEHVHSHEVLEQLKTIGVDYAQGFWLGEPRTLDLHGVFDRTVPLSGAGGPRPLPEEMTLRLLG